MSGTARTAAYTPPATAAPSVAAADVVRGGLAAERPRAMPSPASRLNRSLLPGDAPARIAPMHIGLVPELRTIRDTSPDPRFQGPVLPLIIIVILVAVGYGCLRRVRRVLDAELRGHGIPMDD